VVSHSPDPPAATPQSEDTHVVLARIESRLSELVGFMLIAALTDQMIAMPRPAPASAPASNLHALMAALFLGILIGWILRVLAGDLAFEYPLA
jgi:hypothetical protein